MCNIIYVSTIHISVGFGTLEKQICPCFHFLRGDKNPFPCRGKKQHFVLQLVRNHMSETKLPGLVCPIYRVARRWGQL